MNEHQTNKIHNTQPTAPQLPDQRGLTDAKMREIKSLGDPAYEQEESDIM